MESKAIVLILVALSLTGILAVYSVDPLRGEKWGESLFSRQIIWNLVGWVAFIFLSQIDYHQWVKRGWLWYFLMILFLGAVLVFGKGDEVGSRRWLFSQSVQPSEGAKILLVLFLTHYFSEQRENFDFWPLLFKSGILSLLPLVLVFEEPDLGSSLVLLVIWLGALLVCGFSARKWAVIGGVGGGLLPLSWFVLEDYQKDRLLSFIDPEKDPLGSGYHILQSKIAIGAGGFTGQGWLSGTQSQLYFLPARHTDFIFASWCEQMGFLGGMLIIVLLGVLSYLFLVVALRSSDLEGKILASLLAISLLFQWAVNIGMNLGIMPVTGIALPFISYGGSSLVANLASAGLVYNVSKSGGKESWKKWI